MIVRNLHILRRHPWRECPICGDEFSTAANVSEHPADTCSARCAILLEQYAQEHDLTIDEAAKQWAR